MTSYLHALGHIPTQLHMWHKLQLLQLALKIPTRSCLVCNLSAMLLHDWQFDCWEQVEFATRPRDNGIIDPTNSRTGTYLFHARQWIVGISSLWGKTECILPTTEQTHHEICSPHRTNRQPSHNHSLIMNSWWAADKSAQLDRMQSDGVRLPLSVH